MAGLLFKGPHLFRHGHAVFGLVHARHIANYKAVSANLIHADIATTDEISPPLLTQDIKNRIAGLVKHAAIGPIAQFELLLQRFQKSELKATLLLCAEQLSN